MKTITELRQEIVDRSLQAFHEGLFSGTSGNMSCYLREEDLMIITPTSVRYDVMRAEDIVALRLDGTVVEGHLKPSSEWRMHAAVYEGCPDVNAVFHTHSPYATAFAVNHQTIPAVLIGIALWGVGMGAQESILKAAVTTMVPKASRATGYGIFECSFGAFWFLGSWLMGALYDVSIPAMIAVSVIAQLAAIPLYMRSDRLGRPLETK